MRIFLLLLLWTSSAESLLKRCFSCRSRGTLGDCRDPFYVTGNSTTLEHKSHGVKTSPCASGWCSKILEDVDKIHSVDESYGGATQRDCLVRPPSDGVQRCAFVKINHRNVYMFVRKCVGNATNMCRKCVEHQLLQNQNVQKSHDY